MNPKMIEDILDLLSFRITRENILKFSNWHMIIGIIGTWIVGIGRYWDDPRANFLQSVGSGSVIYIFILSFFIWIIVWPFKIPDWRYKIVLIFISLTSFPAIFYAIPVERFFDLKLANQLNVWFLAIVAIWRLCLLYYFFKIFSQLTNRIILVITLMPICLIISVLSSLNLHHVVFNIMGGIRNPSPHDSSYFVLLILTGGSLILSLPLIVSYLILVYYRRKDTN